MKSKKQDLGSRSKIKIISSGNPFDVKVIDQKTGDVIGLIQKIVWSCDVTDQIPKCVIELVGVPIEAEVNANIVKVKPKKIKIKRTDKINKTTVTTKKS